MEESIRLISTIIALIIFLSLSWYYRKSFRKDKMKSKDLGPIIGFFIVIGSIAMALYLM